MGKRYETKRKEVSEIRENGERIKAEKDMLEREYAYLDSIEAGMSEYDDEINAAIMAVREAKTREDTRIEEEYQENEANKERVTGEIGKEIDKLQNGMDTLNNMNGLPFGARGVEHAKAEYSNQQEAYKELLSELDGEGHSHMSADSAASSYMLDQISTNESSEVDNEGSDSSGFSGLLNTKEGYSAFLQSANLVGKADFGALDVRTARDISAAIQETKEMFPELDLRFVGSTQARNKAIGQTLTDYYMKAYRQYNPDVPEDKLREAVQRQVEADLEPFEPGQRTIAVSLFVSNPSGVMDSIFSSANGITINEAYGSDYEYFQSVRNSDVKSGWKPQNCNSPRATVDHELGHQIDKLVDAHNDDIIKEMYTHFSRLSEEEQAATLSGYGATSIGEFIAESWYEYRNNPNCREMARAVAERMIELHDDHQKRLVRTLRR